MNIVDKLISGMRINEDDEYYDYQEPEEVAPRRPSRVKQDEELEERRPAFKPVVSRQTTQTKKNSLGGMEVCMIKPTSIDDAREITDTLLSNRTVVLNLEGIDDALAQSILYFTSGSTYAIKGNLQKISHRIFIVTPASVDVSGDFTENMADAFSMFKF